MLICVLGRQPELGVAELEAVIGPERIVYVGEGYALIDNASIELDQRRLGGVVRIAEVITTISSTKRNKVSFVALHKIVDTMLSMPDHKLTMGLSVYGLDATPKQINSMMFSIKNRLKERGRSVRNILGNDSTSLNSAQVIHNGLIGEFGSEFLIAVGKKETYLAKTISVQDIDSYSKRDYGRPRRDTKAGMLPPKLAQIMLNLAKAGPDTTVLDPFCGTGVVLMEASIIGSKVYGSDINEKMVAYAHENLEWLSREYGVTVNLGSLICADARRHRWKGNIERVVTETYLGPRFSSVQDRNSLRDTIDECNEIITEFLTNLRPQLGKGSRCCIAVPVWASERGFIYLPVSGATGKLGYKTVSFVHTGRKELVYYRSGQAVARELLVLEPS